MTENPVSTKCESCGRVFACGAATGKCWCFDVELTPETLAELREDFGSCFCPDCLLSASGADRANPYDEKEK